MKKNIKYIFVFLFFLFLFFLSPISGDDWSNYLVGSEGIRHSLGVTLGMYFDWEGRIVSRMLINILTYNKWLWNILNSLVVCGIIYIGIKFVDEKPKKIIFPLMLLVVIGMNLFSFSQVMTWIAGNITYLFIIPVILWYFYFILNNDKYNKWFVFIFSLINLFGCMFVENMAIVIIVGNILLLIFKFIKNKRVDKRIILYLGLSIFGTLVMLLSPGTKYRNSVENIQFNKLNIFEKVFYNIPNFVYYTFIVNSFMLILMNLSNYYIIRDKISNKYLKCFLIVFMLSISIVTIMIYPLSLFSDVSLDFLINQNNIFIILYWLLYLIISFVLIVIYCYKDFVNIFLFIIGIISNLCMLISPTWGFRTSFFTYLIFSILALRIINFYIKDNKVINYSVYIITGLMFILYLVFYINIYNCQLKVEEQVKSDDSIIYIDGFSKFAPCNINPTNSYHIGKFKDYYNISSEKDIVIVYDKWIYDFIYKG